MEIYTDAHMCEGVVMSGDGIFIWNRVDLESVVGGFGKCRGWIWKVSHGAKEARGGNINFIYIGPRQQIMCLPWLPESSHGIKEARSGIQ